MSTETAEWLERISQIKWRIDAATDRIPALVDLANQARGQWAKEATQSLLDALKQLAIKQDELNHALNDVD